MIIFVYYKYHYCKCHRYYHNHVHQCYNCIVFIPITITITYKSNVLNNIITVSLPLPMHIELQTKLTNSQFPLRDQLPVNYKCVQIEAVGIARQELFNLELTIPIFSAREISGIDSEMASSVLVLVPEREVMRWSVVMCWSVSRSFVFCVKMKLIRVSHLFKIVA